MTKKRDARREPRFKLSDFKYAALRTNSTWELAQSFGIDANTCRRFILYQGIEHKFDLWRDEEKAPQSRAKRKRAI